MELYYYDTEGTCYIFHSIKRTTCQLHGEFTGMIVHGQKIRVSGKPSNALYPCNASDLRKESLDYLALKHPSILNKG